MSNHPKMEEVKTCRGLELNLYEEDALEEHMMVLKKKMDDKPGHTYDLLRQRS